MKYLHKFATQTQFESYYNGENYEEPFVGLIAETSGVSYNKASTPIDYNTTPLTIEVTKGSGYITLNKTHIKYKVNNGEWTLGNKSTISVSRGDKIQLKQDLEMSYTSGEYYPIILESNASNDFEYEIYGNLMSVYQENGFENVTEFDTGYTNVFAREFSECNYLTSAENLVLPATALTEGCYYNMFSSCNSITKSPSILPATTLGDYCYFAMFSACTSLTTGPTSIGTSATTLADYCCHRMFTGCVSLIVAPELPATTSAISCYEEMFYDCTSLTTAPSILPAMTLANYCYQEMFYNCRSLITAPELPATTLAQSCYSDMFYHCYSLTTAPSILPAMTLARNCYEDMFEGCTSLTTAPVLPATTLATRCYSSMFAGCTGLTTAPSILPATTLAESCYQYMFSGCESLTTAPELPAINFAEGCYSNMFNGCNSLNYIKCLANAMHSDFYTFKWVDDVASAGTFVKNTSMSGWTRGTSGIPSGWTVENYTPEPPQPVDYKDMPLTIEITSGSGELTLQRTRIKYKVNDGSWILGNYDTISVSSGDTIQLKQYLEVIPTSNGYIPLILENDTSNNFEYRVYGNIMSVYLEKGFENVTEFDTEDTYAFKNEFGYCSHLVSAENLVLPATTLSEGCYSEMFNYCTGLTTAPSILPATTLANYCYQYMFNDCESLITVPELPSTTLADGCYFYMFMSCTSLTTTPELPATTLASNCYYGMFAFCSSLNYIKCLATDISASYCTVSWTYNVSSTGTFVKNPNMSSWTRDDDGIPNNWTVEDAS